MSECHSTVSCWSAARRNEWEFARTKKDVGSISTYVSVNIFIVPLLKQPILQGWVISCVSFHIKGQMTNTEKFQEDAYYPLILSLIFQIKFIFCCRSGISKAFLFSILYIILITQFSMNIGIKKTFHFLGIHWDSLKCISFFSQLVLKKTLFCY